MLRVAIICPDVPLTVELEGKLKLISGVNLIRAFDDYPAALQLSRFLRAQSPEVVFLSAQSMNGLTDALATIEDVNPGTPVVAIHRSCEPQLLLEVMRAGVREFVALPFEAPVLTGCLSRVRDALERRPITSGATDLVYSFLPSKAGVGTSTIALNCAVALSEIDSTRTLMADFDLNSGMLRFMLKLDNPYSIVHAAERSDQMDEDFWPQLVTSMGSLDVIHAGKLNPHFRIEPTQIHNIVDFSRRNYRVICADLSGNMERYSIEMMQESKAVYMVCTPEIPSLHLAREKLNYLESFGLRDRTKLLLNRCHKRMPIKKSDIEALLGQPIDLEIPNDYASISKALTAATPVERAVEFSLKCKELAHALLQRTPPRSEEPKRKFIEFFSVTPRYSLETRNSGA